MSIRFEEFPDSEAICAQVIREALDPVGVYSSVPKSPTFPLVTVKRLGGRPAEVHHLDNARIQIDVWGRSKSEARTLADQARVALHEAEGRIFEPGSGSDDVVAGLVTAVDDGLGLTWLPDQATGRDRYFFTVQVYGHV